VLFIDVVFNEKSKNLSIYIALGEDNEEERISASVFISNEDQFSKVYNIINELVKNVNIYNNVNLTFKHIKNDKLIGKINLLVREISVALRGETAVIKNQITHMLQGEQR